MEEATPSGSLELNPQLGLENMTPKVGSKGNCLASIRGEGKIKYSCQRKGVSLDNTTDRPKGKTAQHCFIYRLHKGLYSVRYIAGEHGSGMDAHTSTTGPIDLSALQNNGRKN